MAFKPLALAAALLICGPAVLLTCGTAAARMQPNPPPSGIVIHLFGPDAITNRILPGNPMRSTPPGTTSTESASTAGTAQPYPEPSMHDVLHQMFVTGDPDVTVGSNLATGRRNDHP